MPTPGELDEFRIEDSDSLRTREEHEFYDWCVGLLEDAGIVGTLKNDYVYKASAVHGEIHLESGASYRMKLSKSSVEFEPSQPDSPSIAFADAAVETDGNELEANQVARAFRAVRRETALSRAWQASTSIASNPMFTFQNLRVLSREGEVAMDIEVDEAKFTVVVRRTNSPGIFSYGVSSNIAILNSFRVLDAVLSDIAAEGGYTPNPSALISAMITTAEGVQKDPEWAAAGVHRRTL